MAGFLDSIRNAFGTGEPAEGSDQQKKEQGLVAKMKQWNPDNTASQSAATTDPTTGIGPGAVQEKQQQGTAGVPGATVPAATPEQPATSTALDTAGKVSPDLPPEAAYDAPILKAYHNFLNDPKNKADFSKIPGLKQRIDENLAPENNPTLAAYGNEINKINQNIQDVIKQKGEQVNKSEWAQVFDQLSQGLLQYAAGAYGLKHGLNMSGIKFSQTDWQQRLNNRLGTLNDQIDALKEGRGVAQMNLGQEQQHAVAGAQSDLGLNVEQEKERAKSERDAADLALKEGVLFSRTQLRTNQAEQQRAAKLAQQGDAKSLQDLQKQAVQADNQYNAIQQSIGILQQVKDGQLKGNDKQVNMMLDKELSKFGVSSADLGMEESHLWGLYTSQNPGAGIQFLQGRLKEADNNRKTIHAAKDAGIQKMQGGGTAAPTTAPSASAPTAAPSAAGNALTTADRQALDWANANPKDPRATQIKQRLGM